MVSVTNNSRNPKRHKETNPNYQKQNTNSVGPCHSIHPPVMCKNFYSYHSSPRQTLLLSSFSMYN